MRDGPNGSTGQPRPDVDGLKATKNSRGERAAGYLRVSTREQASSGFSMEDQEDKLRRLGAARDCGSLTLFPDPGISGETIEGRPGLSAMLLAIQDGQFDAVYVVDDSRLGRGDLVGAVIRDRLRRAKVRLVTPSGERDLSDPGDSFMATVLGAASALEQSLRTQKTLEGHRRAALNGHMPGGPPPFGYRIVREDNGRHKRLEVDDRERQVLDVAAKVLVEERGTTGDAVVRLSALGLTRRRGARWTRDHLRRRLLLDHLSTGEWYWGATSEYGTAATPIRIPRLLTPERHQQIKEALARSAKGARQLPERFYPLSGRIVGECGGTYTGRWRKQPQRRLYRCRNTQVEAADRCRDKELFAEPIETEVWRVVAELLSHPDRLVAMAEDFLGLRGEHAAVEANQLADLDRKIARHRRTLSTQVGDLLRLGVDAAAVRDATCDLQREIEALSKHRATVAAWQRQTATEADRMGRLRTLALGASERLRTMSPEEQAAVYGLLDVRVMILEHSTRTSPTKVLVEGHVDARLDLGRDAGSLRSLPHLVSAG